jgi:hypothetical protein
LNEAFPDVTFDATIKIQHIIDHAELLPELRRSGCLFITSAVEAVDDDILRLLSKNHTSRDFDRAVALTREAGIALAPTFVAFTPWAHEAAGRPAPNLAGKNSLRLVTSGTCCTRTLFGGDCMGLVRSWFGHPLRFLIT